MVEYCDPNIPGPRIDRQNGSDYTFLIELDMEIMWRGAADTEIACFVGNGQP